MEMVLIGFMMFLSIMVVIIILNIEKLTYKLDSVIKMLHTFDIKLYQYEKEKEMIEKQQKDKS